MEFRCRKCGYGISVAGELPLCPNCHTADWERVVARRGMPSRLDP